MTKIDPADLKAALKSIRPEVRKLWAANDAEVSERGLTLVAEIGAMNLEAPARPVG